MRLTWSLNFLRNFDQDPFIALVEVVLIIIFILLFLRWVFQR